MLVVSNTLTRKKEAFRPGLPGKASARKGRPGRKVGMYVCGITVYDRCHIGHARSAIVFDVIRRYLVYKKFKVRYVQNFTDVDDKIIYKAQQEGRSWHDVAETYIKAYREDMARLKVRPADIEPRATEYISEMIALIRKLVKKDYAYSMEGSVYYRVKRFKGYGKLSGRRIEELVAGARVEPDERKEDPLDFALWKASKPGEPTWDSPWGPGRPGWHIECSAMALRLLGNGLTIHGGGKDLVFPHHENEIAQSEGVSGKRFSRYWLHNGFVNINQEKMSKSLGNFFTIKEIFEKMTWPEDVTAEVLRYFLLSVHYQSPIEFSDEALAAAKSGLDNFYRMFQKLNEQGANKPKREDRKIKEFLKRFPSRFETAMDDDFNTALAMGEMQQLRAVVNKGLDQGLSEVTVKQIRGLFKRYGDLLGIGCLPTAEWTVSREAHGALTQEDITRLIEQRDDARRQKDWVESDNIRKQLLEAGIILEDRPDGRTRVRR